MSDYQMGAVEARFAALIWDSEPVASAELAREAEALLGWKKSTTYTVLKRLCDKGIFQNVKGTVTARISREEFHALQSEKFVEDTFEGSLPAFLTAFISRKLTEQEMESDNSLRKALKRFGAPETV